MDAVAESRFISVEDYLEGEKLSEVRHEYLAGWVVAMAGASEAHCFITGNVFAHLHAHLRGHECRAFVGGMKARLEVHGDAFYHPDVMVTCDSRDKSQDFCRYPKAVVEVLSKSTERLDRGEKFWAYAKIETMEEYVLIEQGRSEVTVFRRNKEWKPEVSKAPEDLLELDSVGFQMRLSEVYDRVDFSVAEA